jgi:hypothetical protein
MKRASDVQVRPGKRLKTSRTPLSTTQPSSEADALSGMSIREQAKPYLLATARVPVDVFKFNWSTGTNRAVDRKHVRTLCRIFSERKLQRESEQHYVRAICTKTEIARMVTTMDVQSPVAQSSNPSSDLKSWPLFNNWEALNQSKIELIAGQHRVEALKEYAQQLKWHEDQLWWICDIYDKGTFLVGKFM